MFAADAHHGYWSRCHFVFQVQAACCAARSRLLFLTSPHPRHQMVLPSDSIVAAIKPINSMQAAPTRSMHPFLSCLCFVSRLKDSVYEVREKALVALRGTLTPPHSISFCSSSLSFCSHFALLQSRPEACFPGILSFATAGGHSCELFRYPITVPRSLAFCHRAAAVKHAGKTSRLQYSVFSSCAQLWSYLTLPRAFSRLDCAHRVRPLRPVALAGPHIKGAREARAQAAAYIQDSGRCSHDVLAQPPRALAY